MIYCKSKVFIKLIELIKDKDHVLLWYIDDYVFDKLVFHLLQLFECYYTHCQGILYINKIQFFTVISKSVISYTTLTVTNMSNNNKIILRYNKNVQSSNYCQKETV